MNQYGGTLGRIVDGGVVAVMRGVERDALLDLGEALRAGGVTAMEVTADTDEAVEMVGTLADHFAADDDVVVGAGTVLDTETARAVVAAGAEFVVSPTLDEDVLELCNRYGVVSAPGVFTPTEALTAYEAGADVVKVFPASTGGPEHVSAVKGPLGQIPVVPTGGVGPDNAAAYVEAGAAAVGVGSALVSEAAIDDGDFDVIEATASDLVERVQAARE
jgi:2-dehydro-3-deoxyphosphogluconate aldolase/(4S)-4-hydroxy-2-oxoglutarate aldolase